MIYQLFNSKISRMALCLLVISTLLLSFIPSVFAVPGTSNDAPGNTSNLGWVDLSATVPEGFDGSVFVHLRNTADDSYYSVECFVLNDFKNSAQVPLGNYVVDVVSTSKERYLYDATCDTQEFELKNSYALHVTVTENPAGDEFLAMSEPSSETSRETIEEGLYEPDLSDLESATESESSDAPQSQENETENNYDDFITEEDEEAEEGSGRGFWQDMLIRVLGTLAFAGIFFGIYYLVRRKYK